MENITRDYYSRSPQTDANGNIITDPDTGAVLYDETLGYSKTYGLIYGSGTKVAIHLGAATDTPGDTNYKEIQAMFSGIDEFQKRVEKQFQIFTYDQAGTQIGKGGILRHVTKEDLYPALVEIILRGANNPNYTIEKMLINAMGESYKQNNIVQIGPVFNPADGTVISNAKIYLN